MPFGKVTDDVIATRMGVTRARVQQQRKSRGIPRFNPAGHIDWDKVDFSTRSDRAIARDLNISVRHVSRERKARGIPRPTTAIAPEDWKPRGRGVWGAKTKRGELVLVDECDLQAVRRHRWFVNRQKNASYVTATVRTGSKSRRILMHRMILRIRSSRFEGDHIDGNGLNNRRKNLRKVTHGQNQQNRRKSEGKSSRFKGVVRAGSKWQAQIKIRKKLVRLGRFEREDDAARAYDEKARSGFGKHALLNFPDLHERRRSR